jgi:SLT domain-containing protein
MHSNSEQPERTQDGTSQASRGHTSRGLARYIRRHLAAARRSGDSRRIANTEVEIAALRMAGRRSRPADDGESRTA